MGSFISVVALTAGVQGVLVSREPALRKLPPWAQCLFALGLMRVTRPMWTSLVLMLQGFRASTDLIARYGNGKPCWAVVTGASSGIGEAFATELAARGLNVALIARRKDRLEQRAQAIRNEYGVQTAVLEADLSETFLTDSACLKLRGDIESATGGDIGVLICAAGNSDLARHFTDKNLARNRELLHLNCLGTMGTIQMLMPSLINRQSRSAIVTLGALTAQAPLACFATSTANKSYIRGLSRCIAAEYADQLDVVCAHPLAVQSEILKTASPGSLTSEAYAKCILKRLGVPRLLESYGDWKHDLAAGMLTSMPVTWQLAFGLTFLERNSAYLGRPVNQDAIKNKLQRGGSI